MIYGFPIVSILRKLFPILAILLSIYVLQMPTDAAQALISPLATYMGIQPKKVEAKQGREVLGFAPHWSINNMENVDFSILTTFAYFGIPLGADGQFDTNDPGYKTFFSPKAQDLFAKARSHKTKVILTLTQMDNETIEYLLDNQEAQERAIDNSIAFVTNNQLNGVNIDIEYIGNPGQDYQHKFSAFIREFTAAMHAKIPNSYVSVSVYAASVRDPKLYDIASLGHSTDAVFMMAYDFATKSAKIAMPTAPLYGYKQGRYWYDVATAVEDFLRVMPADKLILGVPYYSYNYRIANPEPGSKTLSSNRWGRHLTQTYSIIESDIQPGNPKVKSYQDGWDDLGKVSYRVYKDSSNTWRIIYIDDAHALDIKYDFAKANNLKGVGIWALGFDHENSELWNVLSENFGTHVAENVSSILKG